MERTIAYIALFAALTAALGFIPALQLASGVPVTAQTLGIMLGGCVLGAWRGGLAALLFLVLVALGVPLLAGGRGGLGVFFSPSAGYLLGWPIGAFIIGLLIRHLPIAAPLSRGILASIIGGVVVIHLTGVVGLSLVLQKTMAESFWITIYFLPGDIIKATIAGLLYSLLCKYRPQALL